MKAGVRVIRGPDWQSKRQDGGEGHAGNVSLLDVIVCANLQLANYEKQRRFGSDPTSWYFLATVAMNISFVKLNGCRVVESTCRSKMTASNISKPYDTQLKRKVAEYYIEYGFLFF